MPLDAESKSALAVLGSVRQMTGDEALQQLDLVLAAKGESLGYPKRTIFLGAWQGLSYAEMIHTWQREYDYSYIKAQGSELCKLLSAVLGIRVTKSCFQQAVAEGLQRYNPSASDSYG